jgi:cyclopropane fatty-acyl-phospholipid synthase-like methyltransferase
MDEAVVAGRFPRSAKYNPEWVSENGFGGNPMWQAEWLCERLELSPGMRVLDLGCGRAKSSIFLAREFGLEVWAADLWTPATENWKRVRDAGLERSVFPLHTDARGLPFAAEFFDAILAVDCYSYFGTDALYLNYLAQFVKVGRQIGIAGAGFVRDWDGDLPKHLASFWSQDCWALQSIATWRRLWERTGIVDIETADVMENGWQYWRQWQQQHWPDNVGEIAMLEEDAGQYLGYVRLVGRRRAGVELAEYAWPDPLKVWPTAYEKKALLRADA